MLIVNIYIVILLITVNVYVVNLLQNVYNKLARNLSDQTELVKNFSKLKIRILAVTEDNNDNVTDQKKKQKIIDDIMLKEIRINELNPEFKDVVGMLKYSKYFNSNLSELLINADIDLKQRMQTDFSGRNTFGW